MATMTRPSSNGGAARAARTDVLIPRLTATVGGVLLSVLLIIVRLLVVGARTDGPGG